MILNRLLFLASLMLLSSGLFAAAPSTQASGTTFTTRNSNSLSVGWTRGNGARCVVAVKLGSSTTTPPPSSITHTTVTPFTASTVYGSGSNLGNGNYVVYQGTGTSVTITGLNPSTSYTVIVYEYNSTLQIFTNLYLNEYNTSYGVANLEGIYTLCTEPTTNASNINFTGINYTSATINFTVGNGSNTLVAVDDLTDGSNLSSPVDGTSYTASTTYGSGSSLNGNNRVVYNGTGSSVTVTNLLPARTYRARAYEFCGSSTGATWNYRISGYPNVDFTTLNNPPTLNTISNRTICQNAGLQSVALSGISDGSTLETQTVSISAVSSNQTLIPNGNISVSYTNPNSTGTLYFTAATGQSGTATITVTANDGFTATNTLVRTFTVTVNPIPANAGTISGVNTACKNGSNYIFSVPTIANATTYNWSFPSGTVIVSGGTTNTVTVNFPSAMSQNSGTISVYGSNSFGCGNGTTSSKNITFDRAPTVAAAGADVVICSGTTQLQGNAASVGTGIWTVVSGSASFNNASQNNTNVTGIAPGQTVTLQWAISNGVCPTSTDQVVVNYNPAAPQCLSFADFFANNTTPCVGATVQFTDNSAGATSWSWNFGPNATPTTSILQNPTVVFNSAGPQTISLTIGGPNGPDSESRPGYITVSAAPGNASAIAGLTTVCAGETQVNYSINPIAGATNYVWTLPSGATINSGDGTDAITVNFSGSASSGAIQVYGENQCGQGNSSTLNVTVNPLPQSPGIVSGDISVCQGENGVTYTIAAIPNATSVTWGVPSGAIINGSSTTQVLVDYPVSAVSGDITIYGTNACGDGPASTLSVTVAPLPDPAGPITGLNLISFCPPSGNQSYQITPVANASTYDWTLPTGVSIVSGTGTATVTLAFANNAISGDIIVTPQNACGSNGSSALTLVVDQLPAQDVCVVSVDETSQHNIVVWQKPIAFDIDSFYVYREIAGLGFTKIAAVHYDSLSQYLDTDAGINPNATQYRYKVSALDTCGNEGPQSTFHQTIYQFPPQVAGNDIILDWEDYVGLPAGFYYRILRDSANTDSWSAIDSVPSGITVYTDLNGLLEGPSIRYIIEIVIPNSCVATRAQNHNSTRSNRTQPIVASVEENNLLALVQLVPNPATDLTRISIAGSVSPMQVEVYDINGRLITSERWNTSSGDLNISTFEAGVYVVRVIVNGQSAHLRLVKQ